MSSVTLLSQALTEFYDKMASWEASVVRESDYSLAQMHTLEALGNHGAMKMKALAHHLGITTGTLTVQVDKLVKLGLITRHYSEQDRRSIMVDLTDSGLAIYQHHNRLHLSLTEELTKGWQDDERQHFMALLRRVNEEF